MSSFNLIEKIKYYQDTEDPVALSEYIYFQDDIKKEKYVIYKFINNLAQNLREIKFEICQYDINKNLIEKSVISYDNFVVLQNESFVPKAKMKVNYLCQTISAKLVYAKFESVQFERGKFSPVTYTNEEFVRECEKVNQEEESKNKPQPKLTKKEKKKAEKDKKKAISAKVKVEKPKKEKKEKTKKKKSKFLLHRKAKLTNEYDSHKSRGAVALAVIIPLLFASLSAVYSVVYRQSATVFSEGSYNYSYVDDSKKEVRLVSYDGFSSTVTIPATVGNAKVVAVQTNAFANSNVKEVIIEAERIQINSNAFSGCTKLEKVTDNSQKSGAIINANAFSGCTALTEINLKNVTVVAANAFENCTSLKTAVLENAEISASAFSGCTSLELLNVKTFNTSVAHLYEVFGTTKESIPANLHSLTTDMKKVKSGFFDGASSITDLSLKNPNIMFECGGLYGLTSAHNVRYDDTFEVYNEEIVAFNSGSTVYISSDTLYSEYLMESASDYIKEISYSVRDIIFECDGSYSYSYGDFGPLSNLVSISVNGSIPFSSTMFSNCQNLNSITLTGLDYIFYEVFDTKTLNRIYYFTTDQVLTSTQINYEMPLLRKYYLNSDNVTEDDLFDILDNTGVQTIVLNNYKKSDFQDVYNKNPMRLLFNK